MQLEQHIIHARTLFPRGLFQPEGSFRFSTDALLLADFASTALQQSPHPALRMTDLGTGCGVIALAVLLQHLSIQCLGIDREPILVAAAQANATRLGLQQHFTALHADVAHWPPKHLHHTQHVVLANPPWRLLSASRPSASLLRRNALFGTSTTLLQFASAAARSLTPDGIFFSITHTNAAERHEAALNNANLCISTTKTQSCFTLFAASPGLRDIL